MNQELSLTQQNSQSKEAFLDLYNRAYRLVAAIFIVLNLIEENNVIKVRIKELSLKIVSLSVSLKDSENGALAKSLNDLEKCVLELISLLEIASMSGLISEMNGSVLKSEFELFLKVLSSFAINIHSVKNDSIKEIFSSDSITQAPAINASQVMLPTSKEPLVKDNHKGHKRKDLRRDLVLEFVRTHKDVSIKDITPNIKGCSEKTIQRELLELVKAGQIKKTGQRRWSRYYVA